MGREYIAHFDVHGIFRFRVISTCKSHLAAFESKFAFFLKESIEDPHIDIFVGAYGLDGRKVVLATKDSSVGEGFVDYHDHYKLLRWRIMLEGLEGHRWSIYCHCRRAIGYEALITKVIRPLFSLRLALLGHHFFHASGITQNEKAYLFSALPGVGKSNLCLSLMDDNRQFLSDENVLVDAKGTVFSFPLAIPVTGYNLSYLRKRPPLSFKEDCLLKRGEAIQFLSGGFLERSFSLQPSRCFPLAGPSKVGKVFIMTKSTDLFSAKHIPLAEAVERLFLIGDNERGIVNQYLNNYFFVNRRSVLRKVQVRIEETLTKILDVSEVFHINIQQGNLQESFSQIDTLIS